MTPEEQQEMLASLPKGEALKLLYDWTFWARPKQRLPSGNWFGWLRLAGRGEGKTRTGAEVIRGWVGDKHAPPIRIALVAETAADARDVLVQGESGIMAISPPWNMPQYEPSNRRVVWPNGSTATTFSGEEPDQLRGPQFHKAWVDELAKYHKPELTWDNLELGLRLGTRPQVVISTTPRPIPIIKKMLSDPMIVVTRGSSYENLSNLAPSFIRRVISKYEGTRLGRQELYAEVLTDTPGALWTYDRIEQYRVTESGCPEWKRVVIGIDPAVSANEDSDETGIIVAARGMDDHAYVLRDLSGVMTPDAWARRAVDAYKRWQADRIVAERNQGGLMVERTVRTIEPNVSYKGVWASQGKVVRAEPVAALYEQGKVHHVDTLPRLEDQMVAMTPDGYMGGGSPDRTDALVWALTELMLDSRPAVLADAASTPLVSPYTI
jgi:phage terminase large subunit-like protein